MDLRPNFLVRSHPCIETQDLPQVCKILKDKFKSCLKILSIDPYNCYLEKNVDQCIKLPSHDLERELKGYRAIEIIDRVEGYEEHYRIVYKIVDTGKDKIVSIISFGIHDYAYDIARSRVNQT
ncbi:MAG: hypothetical protein DSM106950_10380 [Stigonema ocellatum SAG 48.90 = DSM 106950]|nr:hypothetical protein [Stigonema ocellatum SAG 48.90 = DSM 106950]